MTGTKAVAFRIACFLAGAAITSVWATLAVAAPAELELDPLYTLDLGESLPTSEVPVSELAFRTLAAATTGLYAAVQSRSGTFAAVLHTTNRGKFQNLIEIPPFAEFRPTGTMDADSTGNVYVLRHGLGSWPGAAMELLKYSPLGDLLEAFPLTELPQSLCVDSSGTPWGVSNAGEIYSLGATASGRYKVAEPKRIVPGGPSIWWPLLQPLPSGELVVVDGYSTAQFRLSPRTGRVSRRDLNAPWIAHVRAQYRRTEERRRKEGYTGHSYSTVVKNAVTDGEGNLYLNVMSQKVTQGPLVVVYTPSGEIKALRLRPAGAPVAPFALAVDSRSLYVMGPGGRVAVYPKE